MMQLVYCSVFGVVVWHFWHLLCKFVHVITAGTADMQQFEHSQVCQQAEVDEVLDLLLTSVFKMDPPQTLRQDVVDSEVDLSLGSDQVQNVDRFAKLD